MNKKKQKQKPASQIYNVLFCGTGGQGVLTAAEIAAIAAMNDGYHVKKSEVHGMAQRGGSVESHVRFGKRIYSPLITPGAADYLVAFHAGEGRRMSVYLKKGGINLAVFLGDPSILPSDKRFINTFFLGMLSAYLPLSEDGWKNALTGKLKRFVPENLRAFADGKNAARRSAGTTTRV